MEIILLKDVENLGYKHDLVKVKDGYARNYLIPGKMAVIANRTNRGQLEQQLRVEKAREDAMLGEYRAIANTLSGEVLQIGAKAGTTDKIFGSVTNVQLAHMLKEKYDLEIDRKKIELVEEVKTLGAHVARLKLHPEVIVELNFEVIKE